MKSHGHIAAISMLPAYPITAFLETLASKRSFASFDPDRARPTNMSIARVRTGTGRRLRGWTILALAGLLGSLITGCSSGPDRSAAAIQRPATTNPATGNPVTTGSGTLTVAVTDGEGRPLADALVVVYNRTQTELFDSAETSTIGVATFDSVPAEVRVHVFHEFGESYLNASIDVAQQGSTFLAVTLQPGRPQPTVALLPVSIPANSVSDDRSELTLQVSIVASASAHFLPAGYGDYSSVSTPSMGLAVGEIDEAAQRRQCFVWLDRSRTIPSCGIPFGDESPYTVSVQQFHYDPSGTAPTLAVHGPARSTMLLMDQSWRVAELDPSARRSFAARQFISRAVRSAQPESLSIAGFAGDAGEPASPVSLPERPLWLPLGPGTVFSADGAILEAGVGILEPFVGGSAPVFDALQAAFNLTAAHAPPGNRAVVALLGGGDDGDASASFRQAALASLGRLRDDTGIQAIVIAAAPGVQISERLALAELAAAMHAPAISLGIHQTWGSGVYAALDLAADLLAGLPLPTLSAVFRLKANGPEAFPAGATLYGAVYLESDICPMGCQEFPLEFAVQIP